MAQLVEVQRERGATGGHTFHTLLSSSIPARRGLLCHSMNVVNEGGTFLVVSVNQ